MSPAGPRRPPPRACTETGRQFTLIFLQNSLRNIQMGASTSELNISKETSPAPMSLRPNPQGGDFFESVGAVLNQCFFIGIRQQGYHGDGFILMAEQPVGHGHPSVAIETVGAGGKSAVIEGEFLHGYQSFIAVSPLRGGADELIISLIMLPQAGLDRHDGWQGRHNQIVGHVPVEEFSNPIQGVESSGIEHEGIAASLVGQVGHSSEAAHDRPAVPAKHKRAFGQLDSCRGHN